MSDVLVEQLTYKGQKLTELSREELIKIIAVMFNMYQEERKWFKLLVAKRDK
jgi:hypothetical protein